ncbi:MAG: phosphohistidine phosphatase SixA [Planctomycetota bacterium]
MKIYLVRHGEAVSKYEDPECPLSPDGMEDARKVAQCLARMEVRVKRIECSTKKRAFQTAQIIAGALDLEDRVFERQGLKPNDSPSALIEELRAVKDDHMLVGHLPFMEVLASTLLTGSSTGVYLNVHPATVICLSGGFDRSWNLDWLIRPELFRDFNP